MSSKILEEIKSVGKIWLELQSTNIQNDVVHCSFPYPCECCAESKLRSLIQTLTNYEEKDESETYPFVEELMD